MMQKKQQNFLWYLKNLGDRKEDKDLQTRLLEINLKFAPQVAEAIFESDDYKFCCSKIHHKFMCAWQLIMIYLLSDVYKWN